MNKTQKKEINKNKSQIMLKHLDMNIDQATVNIQIRIIGLVGKNYKIQVENNILNISALIWKKSDEWVKGYCSSISSTFILPCEVQSSIIKCDLIKGVLHIQLQRGSINNFSTSKHLSEVVHPSRLSHVG